MNRIIVLDGVKAGAILLIVFIHLYNYLVYHPFTGHHGLIALLSSLALAGFTFVSGYTIYANNSVIRTREEIIRFYRKRVLRVYPLYVVALATFFICFQVLRFFPPLDLSLIEWLINAFCLQVLLAPAFTDPVFTLWFIGFIVLLYLLYPAIIMFSRTTIGTILISGGIFALLAALHLTLNIVDVRLLQYYFFFVAGIVAARSGVTCSRFGAGFRGRGAGIVVVSYAAYGVYLFHMPAFAVAAVIIGRLGLPWYLHDAVMCAVVVPALFAIAYSIQRNYDLRIKTKTGQKN
ncbi:Fucose 4-O-acetylase [Methanoculleus chikugoensis]|jgi:peptidoglycan/LPS O-acetylase OafA/YrhL|uniref:Fucose 4-O-acetylase n=1 Tax=Methanoculleus chikugoensis TaxID=118126 RepID=A0A1M4MJB5_9EURY|nr:acyltransferase family protein [Methanoculleus chikugoensis]MDD4566795.1 acyltransferase family protein [Methanoculleus chikugoensis]NMA09722.1 acyltransferase [Methanomicrobiales archaeon]SCL74910.1 Fucose 4-O-acetylase [Methanoculleus chikugoensis]